MVFVLDTSGSMRGKRSTQAKQGPQVSASTTSAPKDRFALINFATTVNKYSDSLQTGDARRTSSRPGSGSTTWKRPAAPPSTTPCATAFDDALQRSRAAPSPSSSSPTASRPSARPNPEKILKNVRQEQHRQHAHLHLRRRRRRQRRPARLTWPTTTRAVSTYVRESEDIEAKVSGLYGKISNPVLTNLKLTVGDGRHASARSIRRSCPTCSTAASSSSWAATPARARGQSS